MSCAAVNIVPAGVDDHPVVVDTGAPLVGLMIADGPDPGTVGIHGMKGVGGNNPLVTASVTAPALGDENNPAIRQPGGVEIIPVSVGQLGEFGAVDIHFKNMIGRVDIPDIPWFGAASV